MGMKAMKLKWIKSLWGDLVHVIFPNICLACNKLPKAKGAHFCVDCIHLMPYTDHFFISQNDVTQHLKGRVTIKHGAALLRFREGGIVQQMLHQFKYKKQRAIGEVLGEIAGHKMVESTLFEAPDVIIPVPLHSKKQLLRGYNQCKVFGDAIGQVAGVRCDDSILLKHKETTSQTGKSRTERIKNVSDCFTVAKPGELAGRKVLIVDDVVTTGATIEACCLILQNHGVSHISVLAIAATDS